MTCSGSLLRGLCTSLVFVLFPATAFASGFSIFEQGAKASGLAGAYVALADDASANWYNPANLVWLEQGSQFQFGGNLITVGGDTDFTAQDPAFGIFVPNTFEPEASIETPINAFYSSKINSNLAWGIGLTTPFGLVTEWRQRPVTFSAQKSELQTFVVNPNVAFRMTQNVSIAVGFDYMFADVKEFSREVPIDLDGNPLNGFEVIGFSNLTGDGDETSWNVALSFKGNGSAFGLTYRDGFDLELDGNVAYSSFGPLAAMFPSSSGLAAFGLPAQAAAGYGFQVGRRATVEVDVAWAEWSAFDAIVIDLDVNTPLSQDLEIREDWDDTMSYRIGVTWTAANQNQWRFGAVFDENPIPVEYLRPSIPDADRIGLTIGYGFKGDKVDFDLYYMALDFDEITAVPGAPESEGVIAGTYDSFTHLAGIGFNYRF
ncbi:MAG: outer membrane protein transport protein [Thermoanaerobaculia bacterium]|nr:outer membrane protein transport protein [Thermoanaerobaculia bacterium]